MLHSGLLQLTILTKEGPNPDSSRRSSTALHLTRHITPVSTRPCWAARLQEESAATLDRPTPSRASVVNKAIQTHRLRRYQTFIKLADPESGLHKAEGSCWCCTALLLLCLSPAGHVGLQLAQCKVLCHTGNEATK